MQLAGHLLKQLVELKSSLFDLDDSDLVCLVDDAILDRHKFFSRKDIPKSLIKVLIEG
jgi:hypothetical protein